jgi:putative RecB family exonuclease
MSAVDPAPAVATSDGRRGGHSRIGALSPSRASDFMTCPLLYRFRVVDRLPERPGEAAVRGTLVHKVLEGLFDLPAEQRTRVRATELVAPSWQAVVEEEPAVVLALRPDVEFPLPAGAELPDVPAAALGPFLAGCEPLLDTYFSLEDPSRLEPAERELRVAVALDSGLELHGYVDRLDVAPDGRMRVVDYKTGRAPRDGFEGKPMFQMRFYALVLWLTHGVVPSRLQLLYLGSGEVLVHEPDEAELRATQRKVEALWAAVLRAHETGDWRPTPSKLCGWCSHQALCPEWGGTPPPLPTGVPAGTTGPVEADLAD